MTERVNFEALIASIADPVIVIDRDTRVKYMSPAALQAVGGDLDSWIGRSGLDAVHPDDVAGVLAALGSMLDKHAGTPIDVRFREAGGSWHWREVLGINAFGVPGVDGLVIVARDITQRRMWEVAAGDTERFQHAAQHAAAITLLLDAQGNVTSVSAAFTRLLGHDAELVIGGPIWQFAAAPHAGTLHDAFRRAQGTHEAVTCETPMLGADPATAPRPIRFEFVNLLDDPVVAAMIVTAHDVSDLYHARQTLEHLAQHDVLTGLANRSVLLARLNAGGDHPRAVVFIDLDRFKPVNDLLGHDAGDQLLRQVADRLRHIVRPGDLVARVGGDEFVILADGIDDAHTARQVVERIDAALAHPYLLDAGPASVTASVGIALTNDGGSATGLLADADMAMYEAKAARRGDATMAMRPSLRRADERRRLADDLALGLRRGEVVAYFQPVVDIATGATVAFEALARWEHPELGLLTPGDFLDLAEDAGIDALLGDAVLRSACSAAAAPGWPRLFGVNLSAGQLADRHLCRRVESILAESGIEPERLIVEITERATLARRAGAGRASPEATLHQLFEMGVRLALDDFGTGYSSLTHLRTFPLTAIKIDRSYVARAVHHRVDRAVISAVVGMATALDLFVIAEGVETEEQLDNVRRCGCHLAQGYLSGRPMSAEAAARWMADFGDDWRQSCQTGTLAVGTA